MKVPPTLPRFVALPDGERFVPLEQVIAAHLDRLFPGMEVLAHYPFRVTRDADFELDDEAEDLLEAIETVLHRRTKFGEAVRLEVDTSMSRGRARRAEPRARDPDLGDRRGRRAARPHGALGRRTRSTGPSSRTSRGHPQTQAALVGLRRRAADLFEVLRNGRRARAPPVRLVRDIGRGVRRSGGARPARARDQADDLPDRRRRDAIVRSLVDAARDGKQVVALVELKARFDEQANIERARDAGRGRRPRRVRPRRAQDAHEDPARRAPGRRRCDPALLPCRHRQLQPATTATLYEDLGLLTADPDIGTDLTELFNHLTGYSRPSRYRHLLVAPRGPALRPARADPGGDREGHAGRIILKMNSLVDPELIDDLYDASAAGMQIDLVVRGICCLRPEVPGLSENIRVRSIIGFYLEHSRIYRFGARLRVRRVPHRVGRLDAAQPRPARRGALRGRASPSCGARLAEILEVDLADDMLAWELLPTARGTRSRPWSASTRTCGCASSPRSGPGPRR